MDRKAKIVLLILIGIVCLLLLAVVGDVIWTAINKHPAPEFTIGNNFDQNVEVYIDGHKMGRVKPGDSKHFYPYEFIRSTDSDLLLELKSTSGTVIYSGLFTYEEALENMGFGKTFWIGY
jgi:hypothetical protein